MKKSCLIIPIVFVLMLAGCKKKEYEAYSMDTYAMGSYMNVAIYSDEVVKDGVFDEIESTIHDIDKRMSINSKDIVSEVDKVNDSAGKSFEKVSEDTFYLIKEGKKYTKETDNNLDIAIGSTVKLWNVGFDNASVPSDKAIKESLDHIDIDGVLIDEKSSSVKLAREGMMIDLGSIAKGYVADKVKDIIVDNGYEHAVLNIGGNIMCVGEKYDSKPYKIGIRDGNKSSKDYLGTLAVVDKSVVTSGIYERNFIQDGKLYHHILDSKTGYPVENNILGVSIISDKSTKCDALSTAVFSMGLEDGLKYVNDKDGIEAIFVTKDNKIYLSDNIKNDFNLTSQDYVIANL